MATRMTTTAIQVSGGRICTASEPMPRRNPVDSRLVANCSGQSSSQAIERVSSLKVKRPKVASLTSHFIMAVMSFFSGRCQPRGYLIVQGASALP